MNRKTVEVFHALMKNGWIDRREDHIIWSYADDVEIQEELEEFKAIILDKLAKAQKEYDELRSVVSNADGNDVNDTSPTFKTLEEGALTLAKEAHGQLAQRQMKFIQHLQAALIRIENKTYGICRETLEYDWFADIVDPEVTMAMECLKKAKDVV